MQLEEKRKRQSVATTRLGQSQDEVIILKFGSSVMRTRADVPNAVHEIYRWYRLGYRVLAVVSAIGLTTDELLSEADEVLGRVGEARGCSTVSPQPYALAELLATGERASAALLGIALDRAGVPARVLNPREIGLTASGAPLDSELSDVDVARVRELLAHNPVLVVPGFFGTDAEGRTHLLGRGGSDLTAVFLADALEPCRCRLIKDVDGVYESDPASRGGEHAARGREGQARRFVALDYTMALKVGGSLIQPKAVEFLRLRRKRAEVAACERGYETTVDGHRTELATSDRTGPAGSLRVLLLGLGTVGFGVYQRLLANSEHFEVIGALVRDRGKYERIGVASGLLRTRTHQVMKLRPDVVVDALSDPDVAEELLRHFLSSGVPVVSAGKALIAKSGASLGALSQRTGTTLRYSAAVGGGTPMIEAIDRVAGRGSVLSLAAVLNGTCNFVLGRCGDDGSTVQGALAAAHRAGFAEADASEDLSGADAARKLRILCRHAFGDEPEEIRAEALTERVAEQAQRARDTARVVRQVARASLCNGELHAIVRFEEVPQDSPFGGLTDEWNALQIVTSDDALYTIRGRGAGRWPTTEAIMADLFDAYRSRIARETVVDPSAADRGPLRAAEGS